MDKNELKKRTKEFAHRCVKLSIQRTANTVFDLSCRQLSSCLYCPVES